MGVDLLLATGIGVVAGLCAGMFGIGGGSLMAPLLLLLLLQRGIDPSDAALISIASSTAGIILTSIVATLTHQRHKSIVWRSVAWLAPAAVLGSVFSVALASVISGSLIILVMSIYIAVTAYRLVRIRPVGRDSADVKPISKPALLAIGLGGGILGPISGSGGGLFITSTLAQLGQPLILLIGTSTAVVFFVSIAAAAGFIFHNGFQIISYLDVLAMAPACMLFSYIGARVANSLPLNWLRWLFFTVLILISLRLSVLTYFEFFG